eukprot:scaffold2618_cov151-Isochrysis_galbana.AAC.1
MKDGLLYYLSKAESTDSADLRLYIPESLRHSYMVAFHDSAGHLGVERMCRLLRARVYWPKLSQDVADYVRECHECTLGKPPMRTLAQPSGPQVGAYPFDIVCPMCFNPQLPDPQIYPARSISQASAQFQVRDPTVEREGPVVPLYGPFDCWQNPQTTPLTHLIGLPVHPTNIPLAPMYPPEFNILPPEPPEP